MTALPKPPIRWWRWAFWWLCLALALPLFYVVLTPIWVGIRWAAWIAEFNARRRR